MSGVPLSALAVNNVALGHLDFRYEFIKKQYLLLRSNVGSTSKFVEELLTKSEFIYGGSFGYSYQSPVGPIGILFSTSNLRKSLGVYFNIGVNL